MKFNVNDIVQVIFNPDLVGIITGLGPFHQGVQYYNVFIGTTNRVYAENQLRIFIQNATPLENLNAGRIDGYDAFQRLITFRRLQKERPLRNNIYAFNASRTDFLPYQFKPLLKFLDSARGRLLIADEVGLGKTIEAGLILTELLARQNIDRVLIVVPSQLQIKWQDEMWRRFGQKFEIFIANDMKALIEDINNEEFPPDVKVITSFGAIRQKKILESLDLIPLNLDLLIVDEAHYVRNRGTDQWRAIDLISPNADNLLFLSATPIQIGNQNLATLLRLLDSEEFVDEDSVFNRINLNKPIIRAQNALCQTAPDLDTTINALTEVTQKDDYGEEDKKLALQLIKQSKELQARQFDMDEYYTRLVDIQQGINELNLIGHIFTRTRKRDAEKKVRLRKAVSVKIKLTKQEKEFYEAVTNYVSIQYENIDNIGFKKFLLHIPQRRMASCIPAMVKYYLENIENNLIFKDNENIEDDEEVDEPLKGNAEEDYNIIKIELIRVIRAWKNENDDSKYNALKKILNQRKQEEKKIKVLIFAFFRGTLEYLHHRLQIDGYQVTLIHGQINQEERIRRIKAFRDNKKIEIFLSSRVGSEGLDFQFCSTLINYDLPWNPMELEQRIGRLDRIGQKSPIILIYNLQVEDTIEERILTRLYERVGLFRESIGDLEDILGELFHDFEMEILSKKLTAEEEIEIFERKFRVFEEEKINRAIIEEQQGRLIGFDEYFDREVKEIQQNKRYITPDQMKIFFEDFLKDNCPRTFFSFDNSTGIGELHPCQELRNLLSIKGYAGERVSFRDVSHIVFDREIAYNNENCEFINVLHPLVQTIVKKYKDDGGLKTNSHCVQLSTDLLNHGCYFYAIFLLEVEGVMPYNLLEIVILDEYGNKVCPQNVEERMLAEMVERGKIYLSKPPVLDFTGLYRKAVEIFLDRCQQIFTGRKELNYRLVDRRLDSLENHFDRTIEKKRVILENAEKQNKPENYLQMYRSQITKLNNKKIRKQNELQSRRELSLSHEELAAGIVIIEKKEECG